MSLREEYQGTLPGVVDWKPVPGGALAFILCPHCEWEYSRMSFWDLGAPWSTEEAVYNVYMAHMKEKHLEVLRPDKFVPVSLPEELTTPSGDGLEDGKSQPPKLVPGSDTKEVSPSASPPKKVRGSLTDGKSRREKAGSRDKKGKK